jgi:DNA-binding NtrC family response regulator
MARTSVLVSWIGHADLRALATRLPERSRADLTRDLPPGRSEGDGPLKTLLDQLQFDEVHLLSNYGQKKNRLALRALGLKATPHAVQFESPIDHAELFRIADGKLREIIAGRDPERYELCFHLSPGTPQMASIWLLLGKTRYPARFYQTHNGQVLSADVPFDITLDVIPEVLKGPDAHLQHLSAQSPSEVSGFESIAGSSKAIRLAVGRAKQAAIRDVALLLTGESGTGKEMFARAIHRASRRKDGPFRAVNCAALPRELLESELFGVKKGAFTGAVTDRKGLLEEGDGGTLFLDEVGECDAAIQAKLLRVLEPPPGATSCTRVFTRVGDTKERRSDVRILAATNRDLIRSVRKSTFREDLLYRLAVITIHLPPLRDRRSDVSILASALLKDINQEFGAQEPGYEDKSLSVGANAFVRRYPWPGNVRQLRNALIQAAVMSAGAVIDRADIEAAVAGFPGTPQSDVLGRPLGGGFSLEQHLQELQRHYLRRAMEESGGVKRRAAELLGMNNYQTLDAQLKRLKVRWVKATGVNRDA